MSIMMTMFHLVVRIMMIRLVMLCQMLWLMCVSVNGKVMMVSIVSKSVIRMVKLIHALHVVIVMLV